MTAADALAADMKSIAMDLERVLVERTGHGAAVQAVEPFGDGHSGFTCLVTFADAEPAVLRLSPAGVRIAGPADLGRQGRIISALGARGLAVPRVIAASSETLIGGRAFLLTAFVEGVDWSAASSEFGPRAVLDCALEFLRALQAVPPSMSGLDGETPVGLDRELANWSRLAQRGPDVFAKRASTLRAELELTLPVSRSAYLVHGDFHYGNMLFSDGRLAAVVDWEIAQLGDRLLDLGSLAVASLRAKYRPEPNPTGSLEIPLEELAAVSEVPDGALAWATALSCFKYAAIIGYNLALHQSGRRPDPIYEQLGATMSGLIEDGISLLRGGFDAI
jgi:aminoglycoside phosphotransferase (APT) family kinase protein